MPKITAPTGRKRSVAVSVLTMLRFGTPNCAASTSSRKTTTKKSNASSVQPRNPARTAWREEDFIGAAIVIEQCNATIRMTHEHGRSARKPRLLQAARCSHLLQLDEEDRHADGFERWTGELRLLPRGRRGLRRFQSGQPAAGHSAVAKETDLARAVGGHRRSDAARRRTCRRCRPAARHPQP